MKNTYRLILLNEQGQDVNRNIVLNDNSSSEKITKVIEEMKDTLDHCDDIRF